MLQLFCFLKILPPPLVFSSASNLPCPFPTGSMRVHAEPDSSYGRRGPPPLQTPPLASTLPGAASAASVARRWTVTPTKFWSGGARPPRAGVGSGSAGRPSITLLATAPSAAVAADTPANGGGGGSSEGEGEGWDRRRRRWRQRRRRRRRGQQVPRVRLLRRRKAAAKAKAKAMGKAGTVGAASEAAGSAPTPPRSGPTQPAGQWGGDGGGLRRTAACGVELACASGLAAV